MSIGARTEQNEVALCRGEVDVAPLARQTKSQCEAIRE
jgi:hypothetical protein